ncbi:unnamed protein product [Clonostachys solani]|uniref:Uncharacterized protein n=1 Tax=Clonostachys solani TaxID=160281 RepID=A0A9N9Z8P9_9HYPO|nr:unnamed protein product [Clonostachys solani]
MTPYKPTVRTILTLTSFRELTDPEDARFFLEASNATPTVAAMKAHMSTQEAAQLDDLILENYALDHFFNSLDINELFSLNAACDAART